MEITLFYQKERKEFGRAVNHFEPTQVTVLDDFEKDEELHQQFMVRNPTILDITAKPDMSVQEVRARRRLLRPVPGYNITRPHSVRPP